MMASKSKINTYMGRFGTKAEAQKRARERQRYGYATRIEKDVAIHRGKKYVGYRLYESQRPVRHTWWAEHLTGESVRAYIARMKRKGIKAFKD